MLTINDFPFFPAINLSSSMCICVYVRVYVCVCIYASCVSLHVCVYKPAYKVDSLYFFELADIKYM